MFEELTSEFAAAARCISAAHSGSRQRAFSAVNGEVVQLEKFLGTAAPIPDVRLVPYFPVPRFHLGAPIFVNAVVRPLKDQLSPFGIILRRIRPASENLIIASSRCPVVLIRLRMNRERFWHETDFDVRSSSSLQIGIEDMIKN